MVDCLIIGFNDSSFEKYVKMVASIGTNEGAYRDLRLAFIDYEGKPRRSLDILTYFYGMNHPNHEPFHNADFLWPVITCLGTHLWRHGLSFDYVNLFHMQQAELKEKLAREDILTIAITTTLYVSVHPILEIVEFIRK